MGSEKVLENFSRESLKVLEKSWIFCSERVGTLHLLYFIDVFIFQLVLARCMSVRLKYVQLTDVTIIEIEIEIVFLTENRIKSKSYFSCIPSNDLSIEALDRL